MARGTWEDFTDKYGFDDGAQVEDRDFGARAQLVKLLNEQPELKDAGVRAVEYDRPGFHNPCLIVLVKAVEGKTDEELLKIWMESDGSEPPLPELSTDVSELIATAYETADEEAE